MQRSLSHCCSLARGGNKSISFTLLLIQTQYINHVALGLSPIIDTTIIKDKRVLQGTEPAILWKKYNLKSNELDTFVIKYLVFRHVVHL